VTVYTFNPHNGITWIGHDIRCTLIAGETGFLGLDVLPAIGLANDRNAYRKLKDSERSTVHRMHFGMRQGKPLILVNESGLYKLAARSDKPQAKLFMDWVARDVLPSISKTGTYALADHGRDQMSWLNRAPKANLFGCMRILRTTEQGETPDEPASRWRG
jgi:prophage antirepressor-like protein